MKRSIQKRLQQTGVVFLALAVLCFLLAAVGFIWCYFAGFQPTDLVPQPVAAALCGVPVYGTIGTVLLIAGGGHRGGGGGRRQRPPGLYFAATN